MTNLNEINQHYPLVIRTITPLHIGGPQEKHLIQGLDFIEEKGAVYLLDYTKIFELVQPHIISEYLSGARNGGVLSGLKQQGINLKDVSFRVIPNIQVVGDIKTFVKNPIQNKPYIPGSSLKGAIRSIVLGALVPKDKSFKDNRAMEIEILGKFETDIFRHIKFSDGQADRLEYFTAKIFE
jgi:CRISPR type III-A-associated RAMP protein Csm5